MEEISGRKRISAAFKKTFSDQDPPIDRIPAYIFAGQCNAKLIGKTIKELLLDPDVFARAQIASAERYDPDIVIMMRDLVTEIEAIGAELEFPENGTCFEKEKLLEDKGKLSSLVVPDPAEDGRMPDYLHACSETRKGIPDTIVSAVIAGPFTIAVGLRGAADTIRDASKRDKPFIHELMEFCTETVIRYTEAITELGVGVGYSEAPASCDLISPPLYQEFVMPYHTRIVEHFKARKVGVGLHVCGNADPILDDLVATGCSNLSIDSGTNMELAVEATRGKAVLIGNVDTNTFLAKSAEPMKAWMEKCISLAPKDSGYILAPGCEVPPLATAEQVGWFMDLAEELGRYA